MDEWRIQQQQHRMASGGIGPVLGYHSVRTRSSPYPSPHSMTDLKQSYSYSQTPTSNPMSPATITPANSNNNSTPIPGTIDNNEINTAPLDDLSNSTTNSDVYIPNPTNTSYTPGQIEQIQQQQQQQQQQQAQTHMMSMKSAPGPMVGYHPGQQQMMAARSRSMPYPMPPPPASHHHHPQAHPHPHSHHPSMYSHQTGPVCQCAQHMHGNHNHYTIHPSSHPMYYQQQTEAWYRYQQQQQQQQAAWRQQQMQQHLPATHQPVSIEQSYQAILSDNNSTTKLKATKGKTKKKAAPIVVDETALKYQAMNVRMPPQMPSQRPCMPPASTAYYPSAYSTSTSQQPAQQLPPPSSSMPQDHPMYTQTSPSTLSHHQSQIFTSPLSNPGTPHQLHNNGEFNGTAEFGVPYHHAAPGSVNSLTDALCPGGDSTDRQMTPGPPSVGTPRVAPHQYSFPHTPLTPQTISSQSTTNPHTPVMMPPTPNPLSAPPTPLARPRSSSEQTQSTSNLYHTYEQNNKSMSNVDDLAAYLKDPSDIYLTDVTATFFDDIDALADTYLGPQTTSQQATNVDNNSAEEILLNFLCADEVTN